MKKHWDKFFWAAIALAFCYSNASAVSARGFFVSVVAYAAGLAAYVAFLVVVKTLRGFLVKTYQAWKNAPTPGELEAEDDGQYAAACAWRSINLALGPAFDLPDACDELADLRAVGWYIEKAGSERAGWVYLKLIAPGFKEGA